MQAQIEKTSEPGILEEFRLEFRDCWQQLPNKGFFFLLLGAWLALFHFLGNASFGYVVTRSLLYWMYNAYHPSVEVSTVDDGHGLLIPFLVLGLFWWKRKALLAVNIRTWWPGLLLVGLGLLLHIMGYVAQQQRISIIGLFVGLYGLMGLAWGREWLRASFFPFFLFAFSVPLGSLAEPVTFPLRLLVSKLVEGVCHIILAIDVLRNGTALLDPTGRYSYEVAAACSGIRSLVAIFLMATVFGFVYFTSTWKRLLLMAAAFPLAVLGNMLRLLFIIMAAELGGMMQGQKPQDWGNYVHDSTFFSLVPYVPAILGLVVIDRWLNRPKEPSQPKAGS